MINTTELMSQMYDYISKHEDERLDSVDITSAFGKHGIARALDALSRLQQTGQVKRVHDLGVNYKYITNKKSQLDLNI